MDTKLILKGDWEAPPEITQKYGHNFLEKLNNPKKEMNPPRTMIVYIKGYPVEREIAGMQRIFDLFGDVRREIYEPEPKLNKDEYFFRDIEGKIHIRKRKS